MFALICLSINSTIGIKTEMFFAVILKGRDKVSGKIGIILLHAAVRMRVVCARDQQICIVH